MNQQVFWKSCEGTQFSSKYYLQALLGVGGFGAVFRADEVVGDRQIRSIALKIFNPFQTPDLDTWIQEFQATEELRHPHLIETYGIEEGKLQGMMPALGLVMELAGEDLAKRLERGPLSEGDARVLVQQVAEALGFLHGRGIVHRDIKPHNIMAVGSGSDLSWKVGDLGIVRALGNKTATMTMNRQGSPFYVPPEAYRGEVSAGMDVWALGVTMVQALTGQLPFPGPSEAQVMNQVLSQDPSLPPLPDPFAALVQGCLKKNRPDRWTIPQILGALNPGDPPVDSGLRSEVVTVEVVTGVNSFGRGENRQFVKMTRWLEDLGGGVSLPVVRIPAGNFLMGSPDSEVDRSYYEGSQHRVNFPREFWMGQYEITQKQYQAIMGKNLAKGKAWVWTGSTWEPNQQIPAKFVGDDLPVVGVSLDDAVEFCQRLSDRTGRNYRLPTEAEWEYACRARTQTPFSFGETSTPNLVNYNGNYPYGNAPKGEYRAKTTPVGQFPANAWGLHDMHGNVWEWCLDEWHEGYGAKPEALKQNGSIEWTQAKTNVLSDDSTGTDRGVLRGGSWGITASSTRSADRDWCRRDVRINHGIGFRVVLE